MVALREVSFDLRPGEVHVLFGENGAGKSTLVNAIAGVIQPDEGDFLVRGERVEVDTPQRARRAGINAVFQDFSLVPTLSVAENLMLGREPARAGIVNRRALAARAAEHLRALDDSIPLTRTAGLLSRAEQQLVEIAKGLAGEPSALILDEPTAALTDHEARQLFEIVERLKRQGLGIVYITHRMAEIWRIGDRITILRNGAHVATVNVADATERQLIEFMAGRPLEALYPRADAKPGGTLLRAERLTGGLVSDISFELRAGEVVGVAGLVGSGKADIGRLCFGLERVREGRLELRGEVLSRRALSPGGLLARGLVYYPADRRRAGLVAVRSVRENIVLSAVEGTDLSRGGVLLRRRERRKAKRAIERLRVQPDDPERQASFLSGGNQQKVVLARALMRDADIHVFDEPTAGVDVGAKVEVYTFIRELCEAGKGVLIISSDLPEVVHLCHRVLVVHEGRICAELEGDQIGEEQVLTHFFAQPATSTSQEA